MALDDLEIAEDLMRKARFSDAVERFRAALSDDPENPALRARCAEAYHLAGNVERAFHHYNKSAAIYARGGDRANSYRMLRSANAVSPSEPDILFRMAECMKALDEVEGFDEVLHQLIHAARGTGDRRRLWALDELATRHPDDVDLLCRHAEALTEAGRIDDAVAAWKRGVGKLDAHAGNFAEAMQRTASAAPDRPDVGSELAAVLLSSRRAREALTLLVPYYEKSPADVGVLRELIRALETLGATDKIIPARIELVKALTNKGLKNGAMKEIAVLLESAPDDVDVLELCAHVHNAFGERAEASALWHRVIEAHGRRGRGFERDRATLMLLRVNPDDEEGLRLGAAALERAGRHQEALVLEQRRVELRRVRRDSAAPTSPDSSRGDEKRPASLVRVEPAASSDPFSGERSTSPFEEFLPSSEYHLLPPSDRSDDSVEPIPVARNPLIEGLVLDAPPRSRPPREEIFGRATIPATVAPALPEEIPTSAEEVTSRMAQLIADELEALRARDSSDPSTSDGMDETVVGPGTSPPPEGFDSESLRPTFRHKLVADLAGAVEAAKK